jgi:DNA-directed RNA polymerase subunit RPC12/RpoP
MSDNAILGKCHSCGKEALITAAQFRDFTEWQIKYGIECEHCGYKFTGDKKSLDNLLSMSKNREKT